MHNEATTQDGEWENVGEREGGRWWKTDGRCVVAHE